MKKNPLLSMTLVGTVAVLGGFLLVGCKSKPKPTPSEVTSTQLGEIEAKVREVVKDPERAAKLQTSLDNLEELIKANAKSLNGHNRQIQSLLLDYTATDAQFEKAYADFDIEREARIGQAIKIAEEVRLLTTAEEWDELNKSRKKTLREILGSGQST